MNIKSPRRAAHADGKSGMKNRAGRADSTVAKSRRNKSGVGAEMLGAQRNLWKAGLSALSRGSQLAASTSGAAKISESLQGGLKKLEEVFDQRVLESLSRAGLPSAGEVRDLMRRVADLEKGRQRPMARRGRK